MGRVTDVEYLRSLWSSDITNAELCRRLNVSGGSLHDLRKRHSLPPRPEYDNSRSYRAPNDPTPEEIEARAAECRARRTADHEAIAERAGKVRWELPEYSFCARTCSFTKG